MIVLQTAVAISLDSLSQFALDELVDHKVNDGLRDAEVGSGYSLIEALYARLVINRFNTG